MKFGVVFGGKSFEHEISIVSAIALKMALKQNINYIFCDKFRNFYLIDEKNMKADFFSSSKYLKSKQLELKNGGFFVLGMFAKKLEISCVINLIHGSDGEDGKIASLFEFYGVNFIGPRIEASVLSFNKALTKIYAQNIGVKTLPYEVIKRGEKPSLAYPFIVKPLRLGSSLGVSVVESPEKLDYALDCAFEYDSEILIEPFIQNVREFNLAGCKIDGNFAFSNVEEPKKDKFLDFKRKYLMFRAEKSPKADISAEIENALKSAFSTIYGSVFEGALIRCDFFYTNGEIYLNEINPNPGSMAHYLFDDFEDLLIKLSQNLPKQGEIKIDYKFLNSIKAAKA